MTPSTPQRENLLSVDFRVLFEATPGACLVLLPDDPVFTIAAVTDDYLAATGTTREAITGQALFAVFPDNPEDRDSNGVANLHASLRSAMSSGASVRMALQKYDIPVAGGFEERYWTVTNKPVMASDGEIAYLMHHVQDVTERVRSERAAQRADQEIRGLQHYRVIFAHAPVGIAITTIDGVVLDANPAYINMLGYRSEELVGRSSERFTHPDDIAHTAEFFRVLKNGKVGTGFLEKRYIRRDGRTLWARAFGTALRDDDGRPAQFVAIIEDITERKHAEEAIAQSERKLQDVFAQAPVAIVVFRGPDFVVELANPNYQALLPGRKLVGRRFAEVVPELPANAWEAFQRVLDTGEPFVANEWLIRYDQDGDGVPEDHWFNVGYHPLRTPEGTVSGMVAACTEVTAQVRAREELEAVNRNLEEFAYVSSHDLQEPLRMVNIYTQLIQRKLNKSDADIARYAKFVEEGTVRMANLIQDLLMFSRTIQNHDGASGTADLSASLASSVAVLKPTIEESQAIVEAAPMPCVRGDAAQLGHVFQNLLSNALKYRDVSRAPRIRIGAERDGSQWIISVRDNGIGFEQQYAEQIFGLFKRLHREEFAGTGLGLAISKRIVERYGGRMWAQGRLGEGATFFFSLPAAEQAHAGY